MKIATLVTFAASLASVSVLSAADQPTTQSASATTAVAAAKPGFTDTYYLNDHLATTVATIDARGIINRMETDAFGAPIAKGTHPERYTGKPWDDDIGAYIFPYRNYRPDEARWMTQDPSGFPDGKNDYSYAPVPTKSVDRFGLDSWDEPYTGSGGWYDWSGTDPGYEAALAFGSHSFDESLFAGTIEWSFQSDSATYIVQEVSALDNYGQPSDHYLEAWAVGDSDLSDYFNLAGVWSAVYGSANLIYDSGAGSPDDWSSPGGSPAGGLKYLDLTSNAYPDWWGGGSAWHSLVFNDWSPE